MQDVALCTYLVLPYVAFITDLRCVCVYACVLVTSALYGLATSLTHLLTS